MLKIRPLNSSNVKMNSFAFERCNFLFLLAHLHQELKKKQKQKNTRWGEIPCWYWLTLFAVERGGGAFEMPAGGAVAQQSASLLPFGSLSQAGSWAQRLAETRGHVTWFAFEIGLGELCVCVRKFFFEHLSTDEIICSSYLLLHFGAG